MERSGAKRAVRGVRAAVQHPDRDVGFFLLVEKFAEGLLRRLGDLDHVCVFQAFCGANSEYFTRE